MDIETTEKMLRRIGKFSIRVMDIREHFVEIQELFKDMVVVSAQMQFHSMAIEYSAIHPMFEELEEGQEPLYYDVITSVDDEENKTFKLERAE